MLLGLRRALAVLLIVVFAGPTCGQDGTQESGQTSDVAILQIRVVEGEGAVHAIGSKAVRPVVVQITDETGRPIEGAAVNFRLPEEGPGGTFSNGLTTDVQVSSADGRASVWGIVWNKTPGSLRLRVTAAKGRARAGTFVALYLTDSPAAISALARTRSGVAPRAGGIGKNKWLLTAVAAGAIGGGLAVGLLRTGPKATSPAAAAVSVATVEIGQPAITIGKP